MTIAGWVFVVVGLFLYWPALILGALLLVIDFIGRISKSVTHKKCPYCKADILKDAKKCKCCGEWLEERPVEIPENATLEERLDALGKNRHYGER